MRVAIVCCCLLALAGCRIVETAERGWSGSPPPDGLVEFLPGLVSSELREHGAPILSPDRRELYFSRQYDDRHDIFVCRWNGDRWTAPALVSFTSDALDDGPAFTPDGRRLYFGSRRGRAPGDPPRGDTDLWYVDREGDGWGAPVCLSEPMNSGDSESFPTIAADGTMYFHSNRDGGGTPDLWRAVPHEGRYDHPEPATEFNRESADAAPAISFDGATLLFTRFDPPDFTTMRLMVAFRDESGAWCEPIDITETLGLGRTDLILASLSRDGRLFFVLSEGDVSWGRADLLEDFRPSH